MEPPASADWERLLSAARHLQRLLPDAVLVGGTAAALHAGHRISLDGDHVVRDLRERFDEVLALLESAAGWYTARVRRPVLVVAALDGVLTGIRQLRRTQPLETAEVDGLTIPTLAEMARVKAWLLALRRTTRDYLDTVVLFDCLEPAALLTALAPFDALYEQPTGASPLAEVIERLAEADPHDLADVDLRSYRGLVAPWNDWHFVAQRGRHHAAALAPLVLGVPS